MPKITKVYTKTGDKGDTSLGGGQRVSKDNARINSYGTVDELNSFIGLAIASGLDNDLENKLKIIQNELFHLGSDLCFLEEDKIKFSIPEIKEEHVLKLEKIMDGYSEELEPLENFILPGGTIGASYLHVARTVCRRAEREVITLEKNEKIGEFVVKYLNRLSDTLFVMARYENFKKNYTDIYWNSRL
ncbi:MAG: cob(I)yrinic acid a,c-diamide adenosyltransferase [Candidatus Sericytochromatia bacterium]